MTVNLFDSNICPLSSNNRCAGVYLAAAISADPHAGEHLVKYIIINISVGQFPYIYSIILTENGKLLDSHSPSIKNSCGITTCTLLDMMEPFGQRGFY